MDALLALDVDAETLAVLRGRAGDWGVTVEPHASEAGVSVLEQRAGEVAAVLVGASPDPLRAAQRSHRAAPDVPVVLFGSPEACARLIEALRFTAFVGPEVTCVARQPEDAFLECVGRSIDRRRRRRVLHDTLGALNRKLSTASAPAPPVAERLLGRLLEVAPIGVVLTDARGRVRAVNPRAVGLLQRDERALIGQDVAEAFEEPGRSALVARWGSGREGEAPRILQVRGSGGRGSRSPPPSSTRRAGGRVTSCCSATSPSASIWWSSCRSRCVGRTSSWPCWGTSCATRWRRSAPCSI